MSQKVDGVLIPQHNWVSMGDGERDLGRQPIISITYVLGTRGLRNE